MWRKFQKGSVSKLFLSNEKGPEEVINTSSLKIKFRVSLLRLVYWVWNWQFISQESFFQLRFWKRTFIWSGNFPLTTELFPITEHSVLWFCENHIRQISFYEQKFLSDNMMAWDFVSDNFVVLNFHFCFDWRSHLLKSSLLRL